jgi:hypothetical protein
MKSLKHTVDLTCAKNEVDNSIKPMKTIHDCWKAHWWDGLDAFVELCGNHPNEEGKITGLKASRGLQIAETCRKKHLPRGPNHDVISPRAN